MYSFFSFFLSFLFFFSYIFCAAWGKNPGSAALCAIAYRVVYILYIYIFFLSSSKKKKEKKTPSLRASAIASERIGVPGVASALRGTVTLCKIESILANEGKRLDGSTLPAGHFASPRRRRLPMRNHYAANSYVDLLAFRGNSLPRTQ